MFIFLEGLVKGSGVALQATLMLMLVLGKWKRWFSWFCDKQVLRSGIIFPRGRNVRTARKTE